MPGIGRYVNVVLILCLKLTLAFLLTEMCAAMSSDLRNRARRVLEQLNDAANNNAGGAQGEDKENQAPDDEAQ